MRTPMTLTENNPPVRSAFPFRLLPRDRWREFTVTSPMAGSVAGVSVLSIVGWCGTPRVHTAAAVIPGTDGHPSETERASAVTTRVQSVTRGIDGGLELGVDVRLDTCRTYTSEGRLIGRSTDAPAMVVMLRSMSMPTGSG